MTALDTAGAATTLIKEQLPYVDPVKPRRTGPKLLGILAFWVICFFVFNGKMTRALGLQDTTDLHRRLNEARDWVQLEGKDNWFFGGVLGAIADGINAVVTFCQELISIPAFPRPVPEIGWLGVVALAAWITYAVAGLRSTILVTAALFFFGFAGQWENSMDLLIIILFAVVLCIADRHPDRHLDGPQQDGLHRRHADPRRDADAAGLLLPRPARPLLRHRPGDRGRADAHLRRCRRSSGSPSTASGRCHRRRSRPRARSA